MSAPSSSVLVMAIALLTACGSGGNSGGAACPAVFRPCGGELEGAWLEEKACWPPTTPLRGSDEEVCGTLPTNFGCESLLGLMFEDDGVNHGRVRIAGGPCTRTVLLTAECRQALRWGDDQGVFCAEFDQVAAQFSCSFVAEECWCEEELSSPYLVEARGDLSWVSEGDSLHLSGGFHGFEYCVAGDLLMLRNEGTGDVRVFSRAE